MNFGRISTEKLSLAGFGLVLALAWFCYQPALSGAFQLDDISNLGGLAKLEDGSSAAEFILNGTAGPTGRPIALLSFALQAEHWEQGAGAFLKVNILIHLVNCILLLACLYQIGLLRSIDRQRALLVAVAAASIWVLMPLLATASLQVVQRMTTLSASFALLGLAGYLFTRRRTQTSPRLALAGMSVSITLGTVLAVLTKETGVLLPLYVIVLEACLFSRPDSISNRTWRTWQVVFLALPTVVVFAYLSTRVVYPDWIVARRGFDVSERLLTQTQLLWLYLQKALLGVPSQLGLYQTPPVVTRSLFEPVALIATLSWLGLAGAALVWRRRWPWFSLAVLWFLGGHVLESTVLPLELYFEHRNYLPIVGPLYALCAFLFAGIALSRRTAVAVTSAYVLLSAYFLFTFASISGDPSLASRYWAIKFPDSVRAVTTMATYQLAEEGPLRTLSTIDRFVDDYPQFGYLRIQELNLRCMYMPNQDHQQIIDELRRELPRANFTYTAGTMLSQLFSTVIRADCKEVGLDVIVGLAERLHNNPRYNLVPKYIQFHHKLLAGIARQQGDYESTVAHLDTALQQHRSVELNMMMVTTLAGSGDYVGARTFIDDALNRTPANPIRAAFWRKDLENLRAYVGELERYSQSGE